MSNKLKGLLGSGYFGIITTLFFAIVLMIFPLYYHNYYYDILTAKYQFYWMLALIFIMASLIGRILEAVKNGEGFKSIVKLPDWKKMRKSHLFLAGFLLFTTLSTITSDYVYESFWGNEGRFSGLFLISLYCIVTFIISRRGKGEKWLLEVFLFSGLLVCLFGITDYFRMDILGWKENANPNQVDIFYSTMGNVNTYTAYIGMISAVACGLFSFEKNKIRSVCYFLLMVISFVATITGQSDNGYLSLGALFAIIPFFTFGTLEGVTRYAFTGAAFLTAVKYVDIVSKKYAGTVIGLGGLFKAATKFKYLNAVIALVWIIAIALLIVCVKRAKDGKEDSFGRKLIYVWAGIVAVGVLGVLALLVDANLLGHGERYGSLKEYIVFNDDWGTKRGFAWKSALKCYWELPFIHKLFGFGPDTFGILTWEFRHISLENYGFYFESAHNEFLQYLVLMGPFATACYIGFLISSCVEMGKKVKQTPWLLASLLVVACYAAQSIVNINLPIATPVMWAILAMGLAGSRAGAEAAVEGEEKADLSAEVDTDNKNN